MPSVKEDKAGVKEGFWSESLTVTRPAVKQENSEKGITGATLVISVDTIVPAESNAVRPVERLPISRFPPEGRQGKLFALW